MAPNQQRRHSSTIGSNVSTFRTRSHRIAAANPNRRGGRGGLACARIGENRCTEAAWQAIFACAVRPIREVFCVSRSTVKFEKFATTVNRHAPGIELRNAMTQVNYLRARPWW